MQIYKIIVAYDGTDFAGWQVQTNQQAIANVIQNTFNKCFNHSIHLIGASRTDAGVHAMGQVATFKTSLHLKPEQLKVVLNNALPSSIVITYLEQAPENFHPRYDVKQKTYWYHFFTERPLPFSERYGYFHPYKLDLNKLQEALNIFQGTDDFRSFCTGNDYTSTVRTIDEIKLDYNEQFQAHRIIFKGKGFLRYMIRRIVGASMYCSSYRDYSVEQLKTILEQKDPHQQLPTAPAKGLMLNSVEY